jgi:type IV pilus assembly protein PilN
MARINLLPWRAERRKQRQKEFGVMLGLAALAGFVLWFLVNSYYNGQIDGQNERNAFLQDQITQVDGKIKEIEDLDKQKTRLLARKEVIEELQANRSQMVHLFDSLVRTIPDGVVLTSIKQEGEKLTLEGRSQSNARVSTYMRQLEGSGWMTKPDLSIIEAKGEVRGLPYVFTLSVTLANPNAAKDENGDGVPDPAPPVGEAPMTAGTPASNVASTPAASLPTPVAPAATPATATPAATTPAAPAPATPTPATNAQPTAPAKAGAAS